MEKARVGNSLFPVFCSKPTNYLFYWPTNAFRQESGGLHRDNCTHKNSLNTGCSQSVLIRNRCGYVPLPITDALANHCDGVYKRIMTTLIKLSLTSRPASAISPMKSRVSKRRSTELKTALKVLKQFSGNATEVETLESATDRNEEAQPSKLGPPHQADVRQTSKWCGMILSSAEKEEKRGLPIAEIIAEMRRRYWPGLKDVQVSAPIYGLARRGRFKKTAAGKFKRVKRNRDDADADIQPNDESAGDMANQFGS